MTNTIYVNLMIGIQWHYYKYRTDKYYQGKHMLNAHKPFILNYAIERVHSQVPSLGGHYCNKEHMWIDDTSKTPIIDLVDRDCPELMTKTNVQVESDDNSYALEMQTKTKVQVESDDNSYCFGMS